MRRFSVTVRTRWATYIYNAISATSADVVCTAVDRFGPCAVTVRAEA